MHARRILRTAPFVGLLFPLLVLQPHAQTSSPPELAFSRIQHGWTNYSTAFLATTDTAVDADYATVASGYTPLCDVRPVEYAAVFIWNGPTNQGPAFDRFSFEVGFWSGLDAFAQSPRHGDLAAFPFAAPTGGSLTLPDVFTRGGRPAWFLRFALTNEADSVTLTHHHSYLVGVTARTDSGAFGELYVPTASSRGPSDVQAGNFVIGGWRYVVESGGQTIYSGELATELWIRIISPQPILSIQPGLDGVELSWPANAGCYHLEATDRLETSVEWLRLANPPTDADELFTLTVTLDGPARWFRLVK